MLQQYDISLQRWELTSLISNGGEERVRASLFFDNMEEAKSIINEINEQKLVFRNLKSIFYTLNNPKPNISKINEKFVLHKEII